jgi:hypothetical protein
MANPQIEIDVVKGGSEGHRLMNCYFQEIGTTKEFSFFSPERTPIPTEPSAVRDGEKFSFNYNGLSWNVHKFKISKKHGDAKGHWKAKSENGDDESGTFQAQSGGGMEDDLKASASASA